MKFDPEQFSSRTTFQIQARDLIIPHIEIEDSLISEFIAENAYANVNYHGSVSLALHVKSFKSPCEFDLSHFPFDEIICSITLTSRYIGPDTINMTSGTKREGFHLKTNSDSWTFRNQTLNSTREKGGLMKDTLTINIFMDRRPLGFFVSFIFPCLILNLLTLLSFGLPLASQFGLCVSVFLIYSIQAIRISVDRPARLHYAMTIFNFYIMFSQAITLLVFIWFVIENVLRSAGYLPEAFERFAHTLRQIQSGNRSKVEDQRTDIANNQDVEIRVDFFIN